MPRRMLLALLLLAWLAPLPIQEVRAAESEGAVVVAQARRGSGSANRSRASTTRSGSSSRSGRSSSVRTGSGDVSTRRTSREVDTSIGDDDDAAAEETTETRAAEKDEDEAEGEEDDEGSGDPGHRTLGNACMYGANGKVIYAPPGARCATQEAPPAARNPVPNRRAFGSCLFGPDGTLLHAPVGADCSN